MKGRADVIPDLRDTILNTWRTSNRVTVFLVEHLPPELWAAAVPGAPRRTHHRGQIVLVARALGHRLPSAVTAGLWQWTKRAAEATSRSR